MVSFWLLIPAFIAGAVFGLLVAALCVAGRNGHE